MKPLTVSTIALLSGLAFAPATVADDQESLMAALANGDASLNTRARYETVSQDGFANNANAFTVRTKLKYTTGTYKGLFSVIEFEDSRTIGNENFNNTINGNTAYPVIADPQTTQLNQAFLGYSGDKVTALVGRQGINIGNQRFVGTVGWRQNDQTYDAAALVLTPTKDVTATYGYVWQVNRIFTEKHPAGVLDTNTHVLNVDFTGLDFGKVTVYGLMVDLNNPGLENASTKTFGVRFAGSKPVNDDLKVSYELEYANQSDYSASTIDFSANYFHASAGLSTNGFKVKAGFEKLGSDNGVGFSTPLATLHKFNGWADKFLGTPGSGLKDIYVGGSYKVPADKGTMSGLSLSATYHTFDSDVGSVDFGSEIDWVVSKKLNKNLSLSLKGAHYNASAHSTDTNKFWVSLGASF